MTQEGLFDTAKSQEAAILDHLKLGRSITPMDALNLYKCMRLGARIFSLKKEYPIEKKMVVTPTGKRVASYRMSKQWLDMRRNYPS